MRNHAHTSPFQAQRSRHNIAYVFCFQHVRQAHEYLTRETFDRAAYPAIWPDFRTQAGAFFGPGKGNLPFVISSGFFWGLGGAYSINIAAARSSAFRSIISSIKKISCLRNIATRFIRVSRNSPSLPLWHEIKYSTIRRSRSSAVAGRGMELPWVMSQRGSWGGIFCGEANFSVSGPCLQF